ncbi:MAG: serine hydrolase domain-containing protein [Planctomycetota bacterium]|jgi:CubicO group peptidase (beta-lactamase class C family)
MYRKIIGVHQIKWILVSAFIVSFCFVNLEASAKDTGIQGPLRILKDNPRYFTDDSGRAVYLTGSHTWSNLVDIGPTDPPPEFDFTACLDWMQKLNHNFIRLWTWEPVTWNTKANRESKLHTSAPQPWARTGPDKALDGKPKFNLKEFNSVYFDRLRRRISAARDRGIYVSVMLFEGWAMQFSAGAWESHPFHKRNNINGIDADQNQDGKGLEFHTLANPEVTALQEAYVRKVIDTVNDFDNVLYEISNENHPPSTQWQYHMIRYIKKYEKSKSKQHPVGMTFQYRAGKNETLFNSPADWISPNNEGGYRNNPPAADGRKVILNDTDHLWGIGGNQAWVWKSFLRGYNPIFMDPYDGVVLGKKFDPKWEPIRVSMGYTRRYAERMNLALMKPRNDLASTKYCLANPGVEYLVYKPASDESSITVTLKSGRYKYEWFNPNQGKVTSKGTIRVDSGEQNFQAPSKGDAVVYITNKTMTFPGKEWEEVTPESQGMNSTRLNAAVSYLKNNTGRDGVNELVIIRNGYMVWKGSNIDKVHGIWSLTKSFTSTVLGLLIDDGKATLETRAKEYVSGMSKTYSAITLRHFTTMTSGYYAVGDEPRGGYKHGPSSTPFKPADKPLFAPPGSKYAYWDSAMNQFGNVLSRIAGEPIEVLFKRKIADPIGMGSGKWDWGDFGKVNGIVVNGGSGNGNKHMKISARQLARFGHLFLNKGKWKGKQLISNAWVYQATRAQVPASLPLEQLSGADGRGVYGYNWWVNSIKHDGKRKWPGAPSGTYSASGYNNNDMFVIPEWDMVIVRLGLDQNKFPITDTIYGTFIEKIGRAIIDY